MPTYRLRRKKPEKDIPRDEYKDPEKAHNTTKISKVKDPDTKDKSSQLDSKIENHHTRSKTTQSVSKRSKCGTDVATDCDLSRTSKRRVRRRHRRPVERSESKDRRRLFSKTRPIVYSSNSDSSGFVRKSTGISQCGGGDGCDTDIEAKSIKSKDCKITIEADEEEKQGDEEDQEDKPNLRTRLGARFRFGVNGLDRIISSNRFLRKNQTSELIEDRDNSNDQSNQNNASQVLRSQLIKEPFAEDTSRRFIPPSCSYSFNSGFNSSDTGPICLNETPTEDCKEEHRRMLLRIRGQVEEDILRAKADNKAFSKILRNAKRGLETVSDTCFLFRYAFMVSVLEDAWIRYTPLKNEARERLRMEMETVPVSMRNFSIIGRLLAGARRFANDDAVMDVLQTRFADKTDYDLEREIAQLKRYLFKVEREACLNKDKLESMFESYREALSSVFVFRYNLVKTALTSAVETVDPNDTDESDTEEYNKGEQANDKK